MDPRIDYGEIYQQGLTDLARMAGQYLYDQTLLSPNHPYHRLNQLHQEGVGLLSDDPRMEQALEDYSMGLLGGGTVRRVMPVNQADLIRRGLPEKPGGRFYSLEVQEGGPPRRHEDITGQTFQGMTVDTYGAKERKFARMEIDDDLRAESVLENRNRSLGSRVKVNLMDQKKAGWKWIGDPPDSSAVMVSIQQGPKHYYTLRAEYDTPVTMSTYPKELSEPRLRPTTKGRVALGKEIGQIQMGKKVHPVYDRIQVLPNE